MVGLYPCGAGYIIDLVVQVLMLSIIQNLRGGIKYTISLVFPVTTALMTIVKYQGRFLKGAMHSTVDLTSA